MKKFAALLLALTMVLGMATITASAEGSERVITIGMTYDLYWDSFDESIDANPYYTGTVLPFVGPILISTIQLGSTVDYAILMTTKYLQNRKAGQDKKEAVGAAVASSAQSILVSGLSFFAATFGVGLYSNVDIISSMCSLMARGALCSVVVVLFLLPAVLLVLDKVIVHSTLNMKNAK